MGLFDELREGWTRLDDIIATLSVYGYRAADYNGSGIWRVIGEIAATNVYDSLTYFYYHSTERDRENFIRDYDAWRRGLQHWKGVFNERGDR